MMHSSLMYKMLPEEKQKTTESNGDWYLISGETRCWQQDAFYSFTEQSLMGFNLIDVTCNYSLAESDS